MRGGDLVGDVLKAQGVPFLFTLCGGHISPILVAAKARGIRVVDVRHEATAVFAADAVGRLSGTPGVAAVTAGPGVTNTITALRNASLAQSPVVLLGGATATMLKGRGALQDIDQIAVVRPHVKDAWAVTRAKEIVPVLERAFEVARRGVAGPVFVECPVDLLYDEALVRSWYLARGSGGTGGERSLKERALSMYLSRHVDRLFEGLDDVVIQAPHAHDVPHPADGDVGRAAVMLSQAERPVLVVGSQAVMDPRRAAALRGVLERIGAPVYLSGMARGLLGAGHPLHMRHQRKQALKEADLVVLAGVPCDFRLDYGRAIGARARVVAIGRRRSEIHKNRWPALAIVADAGATLAALAQQIDSAGAPSEQRERWRSALRARDDERDSEIRAQAAEAAPPMHPLALCLAIDEAIAPNSVLVADGGDFVATASYTVRPRGPLSWLDPGAFGTLGVGAGFALGAKLCRPDAEVWALFGDGAFGYSLMELDTFVRHGVPIIAVIGNDAGWTQIAREQTETLGDDVGTVLARSDYHAAAAALGARGVVICSADEVHGALRQAKAWAREGRAVVVNAHIGKTAFRKGSVSM